MKSPLENSYISELEGEQEFKRVEGQLEKYKIKSIISSKKRVLSFRK